jgi:hypothetical protein
MSEALCSVISMTGHSRTNTRKEGDHIYYNLQKHSKGQFFQNGITNINIFMIKLRTDNIWKIFNPEHLVLFKGMKCLRN